MNTFDQPNINCFAYLVTTASCNWGRGVTLAQAAENAFKAGAGITDKAVAQLIIGDEKPFVDSHGYINREPGSRVFNLGKFKLGEIMRSKF